jgi:hypothetical protein
MKGNSGGGSTKVKPAMASPSKVKSSTPKPPSGMKGRVVQHPKKGK